MNKKDEKLKPYLEALPDVIRYQVATKLLLGVWLFLLGRLFRVLLNSTGRVAVTSGDFAFIFTTWQGIAIILIALISLFVYVALDLNVKIILSRNLLFDENKPFWHICSEALECVLRLFNVQGIAIIIYIVLIAPILGIGFSISLPQGLYIPTFISSVIADTPLYLILASVAALLFISMGIANLFVLHGVIDDMSIEDASRQSRKIIKEYGKDYLWQNIAFILVMAAVLGIIVAAVLVLPLLLTQILPLSSAIRRGLFLFFILQGTILSLIAGLIVTPFYIMKMTQLYYSYKNKEPVFYHQRKVKVHTYDKVALILVLIAVVGVSIFMNHDFDSVFPLDSSVKIIAHRGGGTEGAENTIAGLENAWAKGAYGSEIDIQRTKDGYYVLNHDANFERVAKDRRKPEEMTLEEIRKLSVDGEPIPTLEEMLDASKGKVILFIELKGETADRQMADDAVRIVKQRHMENEAVLISLKYDLIDYIETKYPEMETGFLTFASFGDTALLNCDYLALEEESATADSIAAVHRQGKKVLIWTANKKQSQRHFLCSSADAVITDNVTQATEVVQEITNRSDLRRILDRIRELFA